MDLVTGGAAAVLVGAFVQLLNYLNGRRTSKATILDSTTNFVNTLLELDGARNTKVGVLEEQIHELRRENLDLRTEIKTLEIGFSQLLMFLEVSGVSVPERLKVYGTLNAGQ